MNMSVVALNNRVRSMAREIKEEVEAKVRGLRRVAAKRDYPACVTSAWVAERGQIYTEHSGIMYATEASLLFTEWCVAVFGNGVTIGRGKGLPEPKNPLGNCSEQRLTNKILKLHCRRHINVLGDAEEYCRECVRGVEYSVTLRPRTLQIVPSCRNCKQLINKLP